MVIFSQSHADIVRDSLISRFGELPSQGYLAGQAVASAIYPAFNLPQGTMRDLDVFIINEDEKARSSGLFRESGDMRVDVQRTSFSLFGAVEKSIGGYFVNASSVDVERPDINYVSVKFKTNIADSDQHMICLIHAFDINCCQLAYDPKRHQLIGTEAFSEFLSTQKLKVCYLATPMHTAIRFLKKCADMPFLKKDTHSTMTMLQTMVEIVTRNANAKSGYMVNNLFSDVYKKRFEAYRDTLEKYFDIVPKTILIKKPCDTIFGTMLQRKHVDMYVLEAKSYDQRFIDYFEQQFFGHSKGHLEDIITQCSVFLFDQDKYNPARDALKQWLPLFPKAHEHNSCIIKKIIIMLAQRAIIPTPAIMRTLNVANQSNDMLNYLSLLTHDELGNVIKFATTAYTHNLSFLLEYVETIINKGTSSTIDASTESQTIKYTLPLPHEPEAMVTLKRIVQDANMHFFCFDNTALVLCAQHAFTHNNPHALFLWFKGDAKKAFENNTKKLISIHNSISADILTKMVHHLIQNGVTYDQVFDWIGRSNKLLDHYELFDEIVMHVQQHSIFDQSIIKAITKHITLKDIEPQHGDAVILLVLNEYISQHDATTIDILSTLPSWLQPYCLSLMANNSVANTNRNFDEILPF